jgi:hypothetical protein
MMIRQNQREAPKLVFASKNPNQIRQFPMRPKNQTWNGDSSLKLNDSDPIYNGGTLIQPTIFFRTCIKSGSLHYLILQQYNPGMTFPLLL